MIDLTSQDIQAIIFDCDGTLVDTLEVHYDAWEKVFIKYNVKLELSYLEKYNSYPSWQIAEDLIKDGHLIGDPHQVAHEKESLYVENMIHAVLIDRTIDYVKAYHKKIPMIVLSGGIRAGVIKSLNIHDLTQYFDEIIAADDSYPPKTTPEVFTIIANNLKLKTHQVVVFEDGDVGIRSAREAGMKVIDVRDEEWKLL